MYRRAFLLVIAFLFVSDIFLLTDEIYGGNNLDVSVIFLDVGQGDAIFISRGSNQVLIDTGRDGRKLLSEIGRIMPPWDRTIETVILTHPDADHIGAFPELSEKYRIPLILSHEIPEKTDIGMAVRDAILRKSIRREAPHIGTEISLGRGALMRVVFPDRNELFRSRSTNESSVVATFQVGSDVFLFTGDLPREELFLSKRDVRVLKVAHHGSKYSTSDAFLDLTTPEEAVVSVGKNSYGHPSEDVLQRLSRRGIRILRTDRDGSVFYRCPTGPFSHCILSH